MISTQKISLLVFWLIVFQLSFISVSIAVASMLLGGMFLALVAWGITERKNILPRTSLDYFFLAYIIIEFVTAIFSQNVPLAFHNSKRLLLLGVVYGVVLAFHSKEKIVTALTVLSIIVAVLSAGEMIGYFVLGEDRLHLFQHYITTGELKMIMCLLLVPQIIDSKAPVKQRMLFSIASIPIFLALLLTNTRSAWLGFIAGIIVIGILEYKRLLIFLAALIVLFFIFAPQHQTDRAKSIVDLSQPSNYGRINMWKTGLKIWQDYPILGTGDIDLHELYEKYKEPDDREYAGHLHNNFVHLFVTLGLVGFAVVMTLWGRILQVEYRIFKKAANDSFLRNIALGCVAVFIGFMVSGLFEWNFGDHEIMVFVWFTAGLAIAAENLLGESADMIPLSVIVITKNEAHNIVECLESVSWADDIIIVDAESKDDTIEKAKRYTSNIFVKPWMGFAAAKQFGIEQTKHEWVLWLDADERVTVPLADEIKKVIVSNPPQAAFSVARRAYFLGRWIKHCGWYPGYVPRLFHKKKASFNSSTVHEGLDIHGGVINLKNDLHHFTDPNLYHYFAKLNTYTTLAADELDNKRKAGRISDILIRPIWQFFRMYFIRLGFLDGIPGLLLSFFSAGYVFTKYCKLMEKRFIVHQE